MAKLTAPLMSVDARGKFGGAIVFSGWKGKKVARYLVTPANPRTAGQELARNAVRIASAIISTLYRIADPRTGETLPDPVIIGNEAPADVTWGNFLTRRVIGPNRANVVAARAAFAALSSEVKGDWQDAAGDTSPPFQAAAQTEEGGGSITPVPAGEVLFIYSYTLGQMGLHSHSNTVPLTFGS
jgi:hypothetical protein